MPYMSLGKSGPTNSTYVMPDPTDIEKGARALLHFNTPSVSWEHLSAQEQEETLRVAQAVLDATKHTPEAEFAALADALNVVCKQTGARATSSGRCSIHGGKDCLIGLPVFAAQANAAEAKVRELEAELDAIEPLVHFEWPEQYEKGQQQETRCGRPLEGRDHTSYRKEVTCAECATVDLRARVKELETRIETQQMFMAGDVEQIAQEARYRGRAEARVRELEGALKERQLAIDEAAHVMREAEYVGGPTEREAWQKVLGLLGRYETDAAKTAARSKGEK